LITKKQEKVTGTVDIAENETLHNKMQTEKDKTEVLQLTHAGNNLTQKQENNASSDSAKTDHIHSDSPIDLWIVGTSIIKDLKGNRMYNNKKVWITTLYDKTIYGATQLMKSGKIDAKNVMFQVGSNDLETKKPDDIMDELHKLIQTTKEVLPNSSITLGQIIPRFYRERRMSTEFEQKRLILNNLIIEYCKEVDISCVEYVNMNNVDYIDGIHLNSYGVGILVRCLKKVLSPKLGVKIHETEQGRGHFEKRNINYHGNRGDFSERENIPRYTYNKTQESIHTTKHKKTLIMAIVKGQI